MTDAVEDFVRGVAMSLPPSDFGSGRAIQAMAAAIRKRYAAYDSLLEALRCGEALYGDSAPDGPWPIGRRHEFSRLASAAIAKAQGELFP